MGKKIMKIASVISIIGISLSLCACGSTEKKLLGRWDNEQEKVAYAFYENGQYDEFNYKHSKKESNHTSGHGTWTLADESHIRINDYAAGSNVLEFEFDGNELIINGETYTKE